MGLDTAQAIVSGQARIDDFVEAMPFIEPYLERSLGVLCHSATACAEIQALSDTPVLTLDLPFVSLSDRPSVRRPFEPPWRLVAFGYMNPNRRLEQILQALATWRMRPRFNSTF